MDVKTLAEEVLDANKSEVFGDIKLTKGYYDPAKNEIVVEAKVEVPTEFMRIVGKETMTANVAAVTGPVGLPVSIDVVLVLDNTDSIGNSDLNALVRASEDLVDYLHDNKGTANIRVGVIPFSRYINIGASNTAEDWINYSTAYNPDNTAFMGCVHPYFDDRDGDLSLQPSAANPVDAAYDYAKYPYTTAPASAQSHPLWWKYKWDTTRCNLSEVTPLNASRRDVKSRIGGIRGNTGGPTYIPVGLKWGYSILNETAPVESTSNAKGPVVKVMVLMTDGGNKLYWIREQESPEDLRTDEESDEMTKQMCQKIKAEGTQMITVGFKFDPSKEEFSRAADVLESCASSSGDVYTPSDRSQLEDNFKDISKRILEQNIRVLR